RVHARRGERARPREDLRLGDRDRRPVVRARRRAEQEDGGAGGRDDGTRRARPRAPGGGGMRRAAAGLALFLLAVAAAPRGATAGRLEGSIPAALARLRPVGAAPADLRLAHVTVVLGLRDPAGLDAAIAAQEDPRSPAFGRQLDPTEIADRFGPPRAEYERVRRWLRAHGFTIQRDSPYRTFVVVAGTAGTVERTLKAPIRLFRHQGRTFFGPAAAPALPASIAASVRGVLGLDDLPHFRPLALLPDGSGGCTPGLPCTALAPADVAAVYRTAPLAAAGRTGA